ncbi:protein of unknown function [Enterobacter cancerogenus]|nr:protein of unknown function [Enterobacter cancerogenus]
MRLLSIPGSSSSPLQNSPFAILACSTTLKSLYGKYLPQTGKKQSEAITTEEPWVKKSQS